jgi:hypothetical protein
MAIMASCFFFTYMNIKKLNQETQTKSSFDTILGLCFNFKKLKMNSHCIKRRQFYKWLSKGLT